MSLLTLTDVAKRFNGVTAVDGVSFTVDRGQVVGFLGPNGAGKSTTMRMITQYLDPDQGSIQLDGEEVGTSGTLAKRRIGYLPENNPLYGDMLVFEYLEFIARLRELAGSDARSGIDEAVQATGIQDVYYRPIGELSKGYRQRVGLAQAILHRPDLLVLDEPTEGLDPNQRVEIRKLITDLGKARTVLLSTHVMGEVQHTCSRIIVINRGKIVADGAVGQLMAKAVQGGSRVVVEIQGEGVIPALKVVRGVKGLEELPSRDGHVMAALQVQGEDARPAIFKLAKERGWTLFELHQEARDLEDVFRQLTGTTTEAA